MEEEYYREQQAVMGRPIAGQSLTQDPKNPAPYETPPKFTSVHEASEYLWDFITEEEHYVPLMTGISKGVPIMKIVQVILFNEFQQGTFNPDLLLMLVEPLAFMLIALAERLDIDIEITGEDAVDEDEELFGAKVEEQKLDQMRNAVKSGNIPQGFITPEMQTELQSLPEIPSLLVNPEEEPTPEPEPVQQEAPPQPSLMAEPVEEVQ